MSVNFIGFGLNCRHEILDDLPLKSFSTAYFECLYLFNTFVMFSNYYFQKSRISKEIDFHHVLHSLCLKMSGSSSDTNFNVWPQKFTLVRPQGPLSKRAPKGIQAQSKYVSNNFWSSNLIFLYLPYGRHNNLLLNTNPTEF